MRLDNARIAIVGAGTIGARYVESLRQNPGFEVVSVCSKNGENAARFAEQTSLIASSFENILRDPTINYVLNLTPAEQHGEITRACLVAGKSVYSEKPLAATLEEADSLIELADASQLLLACAPATFLWPPMVTARRLIAEGRIGHPFGALTTLIYPGPELFHPHPEHLYAPSAGPLKDIGVYQITALMALLGPIVEVSAMASTSRTQRAVLIGPNAGRNFRVGAPTHLHTQLLHSQGAISSLIVSFDGISANLPQLDVFGSSGGLSISNLHSPDSVVTYKAQDIFEAVDPDEPWDISKWAAGPVCAWNEYCAGDLVHTSSRRARGVLEVLLAIERAAAHHKAIEILPSDVW